jgi:tetratricopeptide (TPR) repeat protein
LTLETSASLAMALESTGRFERARALLEGAIEAARSSLGEDSASTLSLELSHARMLLNRGEVSTAETSLERIREACRARLGRDTRLAAQAALQLGRIKKYSRKLPEALEILESAVADYGPDRPGRADRNAALLIAERGDVLALMGRYSEAEEQLQRAITIYTSDLGARHPQTVESRRALARVFLLAEDDERAERELRAVIDIAEQYQGPERGILIVSYALLSTLTLNRDVDGALALSAKGLELARELMPPGAGDLITAIHGHALLIFHAGRPQEAGPLFEEALDKASVSWGDRDPRTQGIATLRIEALEAMGRVDEVAAVRARHLD